MAQLVINHRTVTFGNRILQLSMIASAAKFHGIRPLRFKASLVFAALSLLGGLGMLGSNQAGLGVMVVGTTAAFLWYAIRENLKPRDFWVLHLQTASGSSNLIASSEERSIDEAVHGITAAMEADASYQMTVNISDSTIIKDTTMIDSTVTQMAGSRA